jgi:hypothetical protein
MAPVKGLFDTQADLPAVIRGLPPEHAEGLTFHLPLEVQALEVAGADDEVIADRVERRLPGVFSSSLVDPPLFRWAESHYRGVGDQLVSTDADLRRKGFEEVVALGPGLAGRAFHPLIRFGYGALRGDPHEIARGLAYLRVRRQVLFAAPPRSITPDQVVMMPSAEELQGVSVFGQLDMVAGERAFFAGADADHRLPEVAELCTQAMALVRRAPESFIAVHAVTGLHGLVEVDRLLTGRSELSGVPDDPLLTAWWRAMADAIEACVMAVEATTSPTPQLAPVKHHDLEALVRAAIPSPEVHDLKLSVSLSRMVELGVADPAEALITGATKLAATAAGG